MRNNRNYNNRSRNNNYQNNNNRKIKNLQKQVKELQDKMINKEELVKIAKEQENKSMKQGIETKATVKDTTNYTWDDFEQELQILEEKMNRTYCAGQDDWDAEIFTNAWDPLKFFQLCGVYWDTINTEITPIFRGSVDIVTFSSYFCAVAELFLQAQEDIIGIDNWTRDDVEWAKAKLAQVQIPEIIGLALLNFRPIVIPASRVKIVLLPHRITGTQARPIQQNTFQIHNNQVACEMADVCLITRAKWGQPVNVILNQAARNRWYRFNWFSAVLDPLIPRAAGPFTPQEMRDMFILNYFIKQYAQGMFSVQVNGGQIRFSDYWYDYFLQPSINDQLSKFVVKLLTGLGSRATFVPRIQDHLPIQVQDRNNQLYRWLEVENVGRLSPWFSFDTLANAQQARLVFINANNACMINSLTTVNNVNMKFREWAIRLAAAIDGRIKRLSDLPP